MLIKVGVTNYRSFKGNAVLLLAASTSTYGESWVIQDEDPSIGRVVRVASIHGANASGKSNLIRAVSDLKKFILNPPKVGQTIRSYDPFKFHSSSNEGEQSWEIEFVSQDRNHFKYHLGIRSDRVVTERLWVLEGGSETILIQRDSSSENDSLSDVAHIFGHDQVAVNVNVFSNQAALSRFGEVEPDERISRAYIYFTNMEILNPTNSNMAKGSWGKLAESFTDAPENLARLNHLIQLADIGILRFVPDLSLGEDAIGTRHTLYGVHGKLTDDEGEIDGEVRLPLQEESIGTQVLVTVGAKILQVLEAGSIIFVDELETSFHPFISRMLVSLFQNPAINVHQAQLVFSTHDTNLLDRRLLRRDQMWFVEKDKFGVSQLFSLADFEDVQNDEEFEAMYLAGRLGALPNIGYMEEFF